MVVPRYVASVDPREALAHEVDAVVIGAGIAGLYAALKLAVWGKVAVLYKGTPEDSNTFAAQGGIAAAVGADDSPNLHAQDTLAAGAGINEPEAVRTLVEEAPSVIRDLIEQGALFDRSDGEYALTREAAHSRRRILHSGGDATGKGIASALLRQVGRHPNITMWERTMVVDLLTVGGRCVGAVAVQEHGRETVWHVFVGAATILATGGAGQLFARTTNPAGATGDGIALAYRAGAEVRDLEFVQFHPTAYAGEGAPVFLLSEALRGEGAVLRNRDGHRFLENHPQRELAPRDVVARAIAKELNRGEESRVYLDMTHRSAEWLRDRFPNIYNFLLDQGVDMARDWIPVAPAAHYMMGGVVTDLDGQTKIPGLFAVGETASTGVQGANRLASNSLIEGAVFARRAAERARQEGFRQRRSLLLNGPEAAGEGYPGFIRSLPGPREPGAIESFRRELQRLMMKEVGVFRSGDSIARALSGLGRWLPSLVYPVRNLAEAEWVNLLTTAFLVAEAAQLRKESRGAHYRHDFPETNDTEWRAHLVFSRDRGAYIREVDR
ncbi:L-aspartate oxidase [Kyrpidia tusciae]|uniref:L-aspartate oxidase n=1 Tax=Kyrpidia tusciae (strain DSM 2912 / NBRC 15312 / T2) TaxID=562970 RepID=D5WRL6_KYRT2|nr:L-aspartate oxidase [Kyrpidia tusciae]ADG04877.1 L-aspartate oxidase [Kyrpidia tusciae DSM 2912]